MDADEEEEDLNAEMEFGDNPEEEGEDDELLKEKRKHFGYSKHFDPVALKVGLLATLFSSIAY